MLVEAVVSTLMVEFLVTLLVALWLVLLALSLSCLINNNSGLFGALVSVCVLLGVYLAKVVVIY